MKQSSEAIDVKNVQMALETFNMEVEKQSIMQGKTKTPIQNLPVKFNFVVFKFFRANSRHHDIRRRRYG